MNDEEKYGIGSATQFFGVTPPWASSSGPDPLDLENLPSADPELLKLFRQQSTVKDGESALAGIGPNAQSIGGIDFSAPNIGTKAKDYIKTLLKGEGTTKDYLTTLAGIAMLAELMNKGKKGTPVWQGKVTKAAMPTRTVNPNYFAAVKARPYGSAAMGMNPFAAATGGLATMRKGGALPPRYLRGETDGMADKLPSSIDGQQPAKLSHGEFVIPADVVSHLGNGNSDAGAKVLYKMMDRVRQARTGTKRQGKQIQPEKFTPGGIAGYAGGGAVAFSEGGDTTVTQGLAPWAGDYIAGPQGYLSKAWALGDKPYEAYQGPLTAGTSPLQQQAFTGLQGLSTPGQFGTATSLAEKAGQAAGNLSYSPSGLPAYDKVTSGYNAPTPYQFGQFSSGLGPVKSVQDYMTPYMTGVTDIEAREARRQADIARQTEQSRLAQAGAYGGSRQAIMEAERQRNLGQQIGDITTKGLQSAYDRALTQRLKEAELGFEAQKATEASRQYGATQEMTAAELAAKFGQSAQTSNQAAALKAAEQQEASRQFGANLGLRGIEQQLASASQLGALGAKEFETQLQGLEALSKAGATQQQTDQAAIDAQIKQFQEAQRYPYAQLEFQKQMLQGLPVAARTDSSQSSSFADLAAGIAGLLKLYNQP